MHLRKQNHHHSTPPRPASAIDACDDVLDEEPPRTIKTITYLNGIRYFAFTFRVGHVGIFWCLIMPFLGLDPQIHHSALIKP